MSRLSDALILIGIGAVVTGVEMWSLPASLVVGGVLAILLGIVYGLEREPEQP